MMKVKDFVMEGNSAWFDFYRSNIMYYNVVNNENGKEYQFPIPLSDVAGASLTKYEKAITLMRWIRRAIQDGTMVTYNTAPPVTT